MQTSVSNSNAERKRAKSTLIPHASPYGRMMTMRLDGYDAFIVQRMGYYTTKCTCRPYLETRSCDHVDTLLHLHVDQSLEKIAPQAEIPSTAEKTPATNRLIIDKKLRNGAGLCIWDPVVNLQGPSTNAIDQWLTRAGFPGQSGQHIAAPLTAAKLIDLSYLISEGTPNLKEAGWDLNLERSPIRIHNYHDGISLDFKTVSKQLSLQIGGIAKQERAFALSKLIDLALIYQTDSTDHFLAEIERTLVRGNRLYIAHEDANEFRVIVIEKNHGLRLLEACHRLAVSATVEGDRAWLPPTKMADIAALETDHKGIRKAENLQKLENLYRTVAQPVAIQPTLFTMPLDPPQMQGLAWLQALFDAGYGGILADEMGVGKTAQMLAHIALLIERGKLGQQALMIVPKTALSNWEKEAIKFVPDIPVLVWDGNNRRRLESAIGDAQIVLTSPTLVKLDKDIFKRRWTFVGIDEAQDVRNPENQNTLAIAKIEADQKVPATGTPVENHLGDLWTLMHLANPGLLGPHSTFMTKINEPVVEQTEEAQHILDDLNKSIAPFMLARTRADAGHVIPPPDAKTIPLEFNAQEREIYEIIANTMQKQIGETAGQPMIRRRGAVFKAIAMMRQATCDMRLIKDDFARTLKPGVSTKTRWCADYVASELAVGRKVLVFANWIGYLDIIAAEVEKTSGRGGWMANINGTMTRRQRGEAEDAFKAGEVDVLFITTKTGGKALNLPEADSVLIPDSWWNPQPENQAIARTQRRGQTKLIHVRRPIITNSIDEKLMEIQGRKSGIARSIIDPAFMGAKSNGLSFNDMINLIAA